MLVSFFSFFSPSFLFLFAGLILVMLMGDVFVAFVRT